MIAFLEAAKKDPLVAQKISKKVEGMLMQFIE